MKTAFPICQVDGSQFNDVSALKVLLNGQTSGRYIISKGRGWHGGIHFNNRIAFWAQHFQPVQAMADGELVAYRMAEEYPTTQYQETTSSYSNNFCLLRHTFQNPDKEDESYTFYSLYMHLQSQKEIQDSITAAESASQISYIRLKKNWNSRSEPGSADFDKKVLLPKDSILKLIDPSRATVTKDKIRNTEYDFLKVKVVCVGQYVGNKDKVKIQNEADQKLNQEVWLAIKQYGEGTNPEEFWNNLAEPLTKQMPPWHTQNGPENNLPIVADGTVQVPELPMNIKAGEHLGYLGKYEYLKNAQGNIDQEYRVHLEVFSNDRPPEYFLKALAGGQEEHGFQVIDGSSSTGVMEPANTFFNDIRRAIDTDNDGQISENELVAFYQAATNRLEKVIAKHPSEWYFKAEEHWFNQVLAMSQKLAEASLSRYFDSTESYMSSEFRKNFVQSYDSFAIHEKERIDNTSWMQDINPEKLELKPEVWHFWPLGVTSLLDDEMDEKWLKVPYGQLTFDSEGNDIPGNVFFTRKPHVPNKSGEVIGDSGITIGRGLDIGKRSKSEVKKILDDAHLSCNKISKKLYDWLLDGAGKTKGSAYEYYLTLNNKVPESEQVITRKMQYYIFTGIYGYYEDDAKRLTTKDDVRNAYINGNDLDWDDLPENVREVIIDLVYVGVYTGSNDKRGNSRGKVVPAIYKDLQESKSGASSDFYTVMNDQSFWVTKFKVDNNRFIRRRRHLK
ncbi:pesticin C-terminus-like muramidase [Photobacterium sp. 2_MG-2023]|uniref:pesticin C-terminus-like muramidase n=1 Tax=Photobacterium sp. 2_MG-2023 TaxID=3062663 RepID=UPI0026E279BB|nr:pesticin C-terminus-like muramidase [Photobacterium sp. 2_MG-2023]MDO6583502.1 pesticin C-terminus-like muramidase [Photobacterium sp. 2_MG-2023]